MTVNQLKRCAKTSSFQRIMFRIIRTITEVSMIPFWTPDLRKKSTKNELFAVYKISEKLFFLIFQLFETKIAKIENIMSY